MIIFKSFTKIELKVAYKDINNTLLVSKKMKSYNQLIFPKFNYNLITILIKVLN